MRPGLMSNARVLTVVSLMATTVLIALLIWNPLASSARSETSLTVYCAAGVRRPVEEIARAYRELTGVEVQLQYASSAALLAQMEVNPVGDLYIPGDDAFVELARGKNLVREVMPLARFSLVLAVVPGNPKNIRSLADLQREDVKLCIGNDTTAVGRMTATVLRDAGLDADVLQRAKAVKPTVTEVAADIQMGAVDAGFIWSAVAKERGLEIVELPELADVTATIPVMVMANSKQPAAALRFARYLAATDKGQLVFASHHYDPLGVEPWAMRPSITLFSGGVNRVAIEKTVAEFQQREGVDVNVVYNGCGVLVGMMKAGEQPDAYFACDVSFAEEVRDRFLAFTNVSSTPMVILVRRGNPLGIESLADLTKPGVRVGRADEQLSALGALTKRLLISADLYEGVRNNTRVTSPTADFLVNQLSTSQQLDAVIVYEANCTYVRNSLTIVPIDHAQALAMQPIAAGRDTRYPLITERLIAAIHSDVSRHRFEASGFTFNGDGGAVEQSAP